MRTLAKAVVDALSFLELSGEGVLDRTAADEAMEIIATSLRGATDEEKDALAEAVREEYNVQNEAGASEAVLDFYENFVETFLEEE